MHLAVKDIQDLPIFAGEEHSRMIVLDAASKFDLIEVMKRKVTYAFTVTKVTWLL